MADPKEASLTLPTAPASVAPAGRHVRQTLEEWGMTGDTAPLDAVRLVAARRPAPD